MILLSTSSLLSKRGYTQFSLASGAILETIPMPMATVSYLADFVQFRSNNTRHGTRNLPLNVEVKF